MNLDDINIIEAQKSHVNQMSELIAKNLGTCNLEGKNEDIVSQNVAELAKTFQFYHVAVDKKGIVVGLCGIGDVKDSNDYGLNIGKHRDVLYVVVDEKHQRQGIGTALLKSCLRKIDDYPVLYEAWGEIKNGDVNSCRMLEKCSFQLLKDLGTVFYKEHGYCPYCVNKDKDCYACFCKIYIYKQSD